MNTYELFIDTNILENKVKNKERVIIKIFLTKKTTKETFHFSV